MLSTVVSGLRYSDPHVDEKKIVTAYSVGFKTIFGLFDMKGKG